VGLDKIAQTGLFPNTSEQLRMDVPPQEGIEYYQGGKLLVEDTDPGSVPLNKLSLIYSL
jgi:hypothetical protein